MEEGERVILSSQKECGELFHTRRCLSRTLEALVKHVSV
jgi:hypothetical protein